MTSDDPWTARMALFYARQVQDMGYPVVIFLNVRGVRLANKSAPADADAKDGEAPQDTLLSLIDKGATVYVCRMCTKVAGMTESDWIEGVKPGSRETIEIQMAPSTKVMSY